MGGRGWVKGVGQNLKRGRVDNIGSLHKIGGVAPVCQLCKETLKILHPPIIKPTIYSWFSPNF